VRVFNQLRHGRRARSEIHEQRIVSFGESVYDKGFDVVVVLAVFEPALYRFTDRDPHCRAGSMVETTGNVRASDDGTGVRAFRSVPQVRQGK
jgi:hypothetical protein